jgi:predicted lipid-binding transport protein (Tim44 family)
MGIRDSASALDGVVGPLLAVAATGLITPQSAFTGAVAVVIFAVLLALIVLKEPGRAVG